MAKLRYISIPGAALLSILCWTANVSVSSASVDSRSKPTITATKSDLLAQKKNSDDEALDALQERDKKVDEGLNKIRKLTGQEKKERQAEPEKDLSPEEMIDAIRNREEKVKKLQKLKQLENLAQDRETLEELQSENFKIESLEELAIVKDILADRDLSKGEMLDVLQKQDFNIENLQQLKQIKKLVGQKNSYVPKEYQLSGEMAFKMLLVGVPGVILLFLVGKPIVKGIAGTVNSNYQEKFGKPKVPEGSVNLHARSFKEITLIGNKADKINNEKFGNEEFLLLLRIKSIWQKKLKAFKD